MNSVILDWLTRLHTAALTRLVLLNILAHGQIEPHDTLHSEVLPHINGLTFRSHDAICMAS